MRRAGRKYIFIICTLALALSVLLAGCAETVPTAANLYSDGVSMFADNSSAAEISYVISFSTGTSQSIAPIETRVLLQSQIPTPERRSGYRFEGWYLSSDYSGFKVEAGQVFTRNTTLYAKWIANTVIPIASPDDLQAISLKLDGDYALAADIDLSEIESWTPIGSFQKNKDFSGTFDGNGYTISGMNIRNLVADEEFNYLPVGLFGKVTGSIRNVNLVDYRIQLDGDQSRFYIGGIVGWLCRASMSNCTASGTIINPEIVYEEGIWDSLLGSYANPTTSVYIGGAIGYVNGSTVNGVSTSGKILSETNEEKVFFGGMAGYVNAYTEEGENYNIYEPSTVRNSNSTTEVYGRYAGGLIGYNDGSVSNSFAMGKVGGSMSYPAIAGGLVGYNYNGGTISSSFATGKAEARTAGGLVGVNIFDFETATGGTISNCYASGDVLASEYGGGLVGRAVSDLPYMGRPDFDENVFNDNIDHMTSATTFFMIENCLAYGYVEVNASSTIFKDYLGNEYTANVFYAVFAGNFIGQAYELYIRNCIGFGDVDAISHRATTDAIVGEEVYTHNAAYADNFVGHSTSVLSGSDYVRVFVAPDVRVTRNGQEFTGGYNSAEELSYVYLNDAGFYTSSMSFSADIWNLDNLNVAAGIYPVLKMA